MAIDSHMHINSLVVGNVMEEVCKVNRDFNLSGVINVSLNVATAKECISLAKCNPKFYATVGIHPLYIEEDEFSSLYDLSSCDKVVAIGEIGLDSLGNNIELQREYLIRQIEIANDVGLPVVIHSNNMNREVIKIFEEVVSPKYGCVFHCFQPNLDDLAYLVDKGYYISFAGRLTYKTAKKSIDVLKCVPDNLFLIETDSPYISPEPLRNMANSSSNIIYIMNKICEIKGINFDELSILTEQNTKRLFKKIK